MIGWFKAKFIFKVLIYILFHLYFVVQEQKAGYHPEDFLVQPTAPSLFEDEDWEQEAIKLYDWSKTLRTEDIVED